LAHGSICYCKPEKHFENIKKFEQNVTLMPWHAMCAHQDLRQTDIFCVFCKEEKIMSCR
jgi:hypothetical protein